VSGLKILSSTRRLVQTHLPTRLRRSRLKTPFSSQACQGFSGKQGLGLRGARKWHGVWVCLGGETLENRGWGTGFNVFDMERGSGSAGVREHGFWGRGCARGCVVAGLPVVGCGALHLTRSPRAATPQLSCRCEVAGLPVRGSGALHLNILSREASDASPHLRQKRCLKSQRSQSSRYATDHHHVCHARQRREEQRLGRVS
jgi:hypothetical protein